MTLRHVCVARETSKAKSSISGAACLPWGLQQALGLDTSPRSWWLGTFYLGERSNPLRDLFGPVYTQLKYSHKSLSAGTVFVRKVFSAVCGICFYFDRKTSLFHFIKIFVKFAIHKDAFIGIVSFIQFKSSSGPVIIYCEFHTLVQRDVLVSARGFS